jgi:hypothetical protein
VYYFEKALETDKFYSLAQRKLEGIKYPKKIDSQTQDKQVVKKTPINNTNNKTSTRIDSQTQDKQEVKETPVNNTNNKTSTIPNWTSPQKVLNTNDQSNQVALKYMTKLQQDFGLTKEQAAGVVGNLWHESAMNSGIRQETGGVGQPNMATNVVDRTGYGVAQWGEGSKQGLIDYAKANGLDPSSQAANYGFLKQHLSTSHAHVITHLKACSNRSEATKIFMSEYEMPKHPYLDSRIKYADYVFNLVE